MLLVKESLIVGCNIAQDVGTYTFTFKGGRKVAARYTFLYEHTDGKWLIEHHHSSAMPEKASAHKKVSHRASKTK